LIERDVDTDVLPYTLRERIGVIVYWPMGSGLLTGKMTRERIQRMADDGWRKRDQRFKEPQLR
jgi:aryl-alcohol dehydrogenase-like predicted oxidoreductase